MTPAQAAVVGAILAATAALFGATITNVVALRSERRRRREAARASYVDELRKRSADVFEHFFALIQEMEWVTGHAAIAPEAIDRTMIEAYDSRVRPTFAALSGALVKVAALDTDAYQRLREVLDRIVELEYALAETLLAVKREGRSPTLDRSRELEEHGRRIRAFGEGLPLRLVEAVQEVASSLRYVDDLRGQK